jgi:hypothetical protein
MGWASQENGALLALAEGKFDVFLTTDQRIKLSAGRFQVHGRPRGVGGAPQQDRVLATFASRVAACPWKRQAWSGVSGGCLTTA